VVEVAEIVVAPIMARVALEGDLAEAPDCHSKAGLQDKGVHKFLVFRREADRMDLLFTTKQAVAVAGMVDILLMQPELVEVRVISVV
jgi:hypothetical protein